MEVSGNILRGSLKEALSLLYCVLFFLGEIIITYGKY